MASTVETHVSRFSEVPSESKALLEKLVKHLAENDPG